MSINAEVSKSGSESTLSTIRKFSRKVQGTGLVRTVRGGRYHLRDASKTVKKKRALKLIKRRAEFKQLVKEGKVAEPQPRGQGGRPGGYNRPGQTENSASRVDQTPIAR
jgi:ribosomal protein S21